MFHRLGESLRRFMYGRYGSDQLSTALLVSAIVVSLLNTTLTLFFGRFAIYCNVVYPLLHLFTVAPLIYSVYRSLSRNIYARQKENRRFQQFMTYVKDRKNRYFRCPKCRQMVRVPKHRGKISIRCPKCGERFIKKT